MDYTGHRAWLPSNRVAWLSAIPCLVLLLNWTNAGHGWFLADARFGTKRSLAKIRARRDRDLREIDDDLAAELRRANRKYASRPYKLRAAQRRLDRWAEARRAKVREVFRRDRAKILRG